MREQNIAVVGSGPAGLAAAYRLRERNHRVRIFEVGDQLGGRIRTSNRDGYLIEDGAVWIPGSYRWFLRLARDAGISPVPSTVSYGFRRDGVTHVFDGGRPVRSGLRFGLLSLRSKVLLLRLLVDGFRHRRLIAAGDLSALAELDDESAEHYVLRRLNREILDHMINPAVRGTAGASPSELSKLDVLHVIATFLGGRGAWTFDGGMSTFVDAVAKGSEAVVGAKVTEVREEPDVVSVRWRDAEGADHIERFDGCVLAVPPSNLRTLHPGLGEDRARFLAGVATTPLVSVTYALRTPPGDVPMSYLTFSEVVQPDLLLVVFFHNLRDGIVPEGKGLVAVYPSASLSRELWDSPDEQCAGRLKEALDVALPGLLEGVEFTHVNRWDPLVLVSRPGYYRDAAAFVQAGRERDQRIRLAGDYLSVSSLNTATASGERAAAELDSYLQSVG